MSKKNNASKIMAILALFWIIVWIVWTWIMVLIGWWNTNTSSEQSLTPEQYKELQEMIKSQWWTWTLSNSWTVESTWIIQSNWSTNLTWSTN